MTMTDPPMFSELEEMVLASYHAAGTPSSASDVLAAVSEIGTDMMLDLVREHCPGTTIVPSRPGVARSVRDLFTRHLDEPADDEHWEVNFRLPGGMIHTVAVSGDGDKWYHGASITDSSERLLVMDRDWCLAEILVYKCQSELSNLIITDGSRWGVETRGFLRSMTGIPRYPQLSSIVSNSGLRKGRMSDAVLMLRAILATGGMYDDVPWSCRINLDLRNKGRRVRAMEADNPFLRAFAKTEFSNGVSDVLFDSLSRGFTMMVSEGLTPTVPEDNLAVRFRTIDKNRGYDAAYIHVFRDVLVPITRPDLFAHEYGHAIDAMLGQPSSKRGFTDIRRMYESYVDGTSLLDVYSRDYLLKPSEIFARCYELYVSSKVTGCALVRDRDESFPGSVPVTLERSVEEYFDGIMRRVCRPHGHCRSW